MKRTLSFLFLLGLLSTCTSESDSPAEMELTIRLLGNPQCVYLKSEENRQEIPDSQSCIEFAFDQDNRMLIIKHINAGFNCCPESLWCTVTYRNDTILIQEFEKQQGCKCTCLYDLDLEVAGVESGKYHLRIIEPYLGAQNPLVGLMDIQTSKTGNFCVWRTIYPWGNE